MPTITDHGCECLPTTLDLDEGAAWAGCGEAGWCDVVPRSCPGARNASATYGGWDSCAESGGPVTAGSQPATVLAQRPEEVPGQPSSEAALLVAVSLAAVTAFAIHRAVGQQPTTATQEPEPEQEQDLLLQETPCKPVACTAARMPFQSPLAPAAATSRAGTTAAQRPLSGAGRVLLRATAGKKTRDDAKRGTQASEFEPSWTSLPRTPTADWSSADGLPTLDLSTGSPGAEDRSDSPSSEVSEAPSSPEKSIDPSWPVKSEGEE